jgi:hypothetical protein
MKWKNPFNLDADKDLSDLAWFKLILGVGVTSIVAAIGLIVWNNSISYGMTYQHFNGVFEVFKFPLQMLIGMTASIALLAALHKSEQTRKQIYLANVQNNFVNYYKHLEEFKKYVDHLEPKKITAGNNSENYKFNYRQLHSLFYKNSINGDYNCSFNLADNEILIELAGLSEELNRISRSGAESHFDKKIVLLSSDFKSICYKFFDVGNQLFLHKNFDSWSEYNISNIGALNLQNSKGMIEYLISILLHINEVSSFDRKHISFINYNSDMATVDKAELIRIMLSGKKIPNYIDELISSLIEFDYFVIKLLQSDKK